MDTDIIQEIEKCIYEYRGIYTTFTQTQILVKSLQHCTCTVLFQEEYEDKNKDLTQYYKVFCDYVYRNYPDIDIQEILEYDIESIDPTYGFDLYYDTVPKSPHTIIPLLICCINKTMDITYTYDNTDPRNRKYETKKMCSNIYRAIYYLVVEKNCICHKAYSKFVIEIIRFMFIYDNSDTNFCKYQGEPFPQYVYDYLFSLLYLFKHGRNIVNTQTNAITRFIKRRKSALTIQRYWRNVISNPNHLVCRKRLLNEFETLIY